LKVGNKTIKANWDGLSKKDIELIKKMHKEVKIKARGSNLFQFFN